MIYNKVFGKIGELVQGKLADDVPFLVTNHTSTRFNSITIIEKHTYPGLKLREKSLQALVVFLLFYENKSLAEISTIALEDKVNALRRKPDEYFQGIRISQTSNIPKGKGLSSSSADVLGLLALLNTYFQTGYDHQQLYRLAALVEPTDPCFSDTGLWFDQRKGEPVEQFNLPEFSLLFFDSDKNKSIDTLTYTANQKMSVNSSLYSTLLEDFRKAAVSNRFNDLMQVITHSAVTNQTVLPKPGFEVLKDFAVKNDCGVFVAHTGTIMGLVVSPDKFEFVLSRVEGLVASQWKSALYYEKGVVCKS